MVDRARYPRLAEYLDSLPAGLSSFPESRAKRSIARHVLEKRPLKSDPGLPAELNGLIERPLLQAGWMSECQCMALHLAVGDAYQMSDVAYAKWLYDHNAGLLDGSFMFRKLMSIATPSVLMQGAAIRFNSFHQGTRLEITGRDANTLHFQIGYPQGLFNKLCLAAFEAAFQAALDMTRAKDVRCRLVSAEAGLAKYDVTWAAWS